MRIPSLSNTSHTAAAFALALLMLALPFAASAMDEEELLAKRNHWQSRYRTLLSNRAILNDNIAKLTHDYGQAQRRNYPRGGAREALLLQAREAEQELEAVEREIESIFVEARQSEVPPGWLYEVEDEPIERSQPAAADPAEVDPDGRNPLYLDD